MMEEDTERLTLNLKPKRKSLRRSSSILKTTGGPLLDIDPNQQDGCSVPIKKSRQSLSRRVSFAKLLEVKEFPRDSPRRWLDSPAQPEPVPDTRNDTVPLTVPVTLQQDQQVQHVTHVAENQHGSSLMPLLPSTSAAHTENAFAASYGQQQQWTQESMIDGNSLLKTLSGMSTQPSERVGLGYHTQDIPSLKYDSSEVKVDGMALLQALDGDKPVKQAVSNTMFSENRYTNQTETLKGLRERTPLMALNKQAAGDVRFEELNDDPGEKTIVFSQGDDMQQTEVLPIGLDLNSGPCEGDWGGLSGPVDRQNLLQSLGGSDETDSPEVLFAKKFETSNTNGEVIIGEGKSSVLHQDVENNFFEGYNIAHQKEPTIVFQQGLGMEETGVINVTIDEQEGYPCTNTPDNGKVKFYLGSDSGELKDMPMYRPMEKSNTEQTIIYQDGADIEQTEVLDSKINRRSLTQPPINQSLMSRGSMETVGSLPHNTYRSTLLHSDSTEMEQTGVLTNTITTGPVQQSVNQTLMDGATMEETAVIDSTINRRSITRPVNPTLMDGATMEETAVIDSTINRRSITRPVNQTLMDGATMDETGVIDSTINRRSITRPVNQTLMDGATMEETAIIGSTIKSQSLAKPLNRSLMSEVEMKHTEVIESNITRSSLNISVKETACNVPSSEEVSENKTVVFQESGDLEETHATTCNIDIFAKTSNPTPSKERNTDLYVTKMNTKSSLLTSARLKRLSARFSLGGDTGRFSLGTDNLTNRLTGESEVDGNQTSAIPRNTIRLTATPSKGSEGTPGQTSDASIAHLPTKVENEVGLQKATEQIEDKSQTMETEETCADINQTGEMADVGITEILPPLDLGITDMLPPDDIITNSLHTSIRTDQSFLKKASRAPVERKDSSSSDSSQSSSLMSYSLINNYSMTESMLENTRREVDGPITVKKLCLLLDIPFFRWLEDEPFVVKNDRCSILPGEQVDPSDMRNVLGACAVQCPFYLVHSHVYTQAVKQADLKKSKTEELDVLFTQEESKPFMFRAVKQSSEQQRSKLREKVLACSKVSSHLGKAEWKKVCAQATVQYGETLKDQHSRLQDQASDINIALHQTNDLLTALDTAWTELETDETDLENTRLPTEEDIQQWKMAQQQLSKKVAELQHLEEEQSKLTSKRDNIQAELAIHRDRDQQFVSSQRQDVQQLLEKLKSDDAEIKTDLNWMKRCLEWRPDRVETEVVSYLFYNDTLLLETTLDTSLHRRLLSATLTSSLQDHPSKSVGHLADKSEDIMSLMHRLIISSIKEQNILTKFIGTPLKELFKFLRAVSMVVCTGRCLAQEISRIEFNNWVTIKKKGLTVEFWCDQAGRKIDVDFDLKLKYRDYCATPTVRVDIGNFRPEDVLKQMSAVPDVGFRYLERLCQAIDLSDVPVLDHCS